MKALWKKARQGRHSVWVLNMPKINLSEELFLRTATSHLIYSATPGLLQF